MLVSAVQFCLGPLMKLLSNREFFFHDWRFTMKKVLLIGSTVLDICGSVDHLPQSDEDIAPRKTTNRVSGTGWCMANAFRILNMPYSLISHTGTGVYSELPEQKAEELGIPMPRHEETAGCTYTLVDPKGNYRSLMIQGGEYDITASALNGINEEEYSCVICSGSQFEKDPQLLLGYLQSLHLPIVFKPSGYSILQNSMILSQLFDLHPVLHLSEAEAAYLCEGRAEDLNEAAEYIYSMTEAPVMILLDDLRCLYYDGESEEVAEADHHDHVDLSGADCGHLAAYVIAKNSGLNVSLALEFAGKYAGTVSVTDDTIPDRAEEERLKQLLSTMIINTDIRKAVKK